MAIVQQDPAEAAPSHPEEIKSVFKLRLGERVILQASARITPAGVISAGIAAAIIILALGRRR